QSQSRVARLEDDVKTGAASLAKERERGGGLDRRLADFESKLKVAKTDLERARARHDTESARAEGLRKAIDQKQRELTALARSVESAKEARGKLEKSLATRDKELADARQYKDRWEAAEERERFLAKQVKERQSAVDVANRTLASLKKQTTALKA